MKEIMNWIDNPSINARMIGIYGMGGIGKTTLAKCIYNQLSNKFVHVSFLPDVRETTKCHGITNLQSQLILDILQSKSQVFRIDDGISIIQSKFKGKKVLILLDDIDDKSQLDALARERCWFMAGSVIIVMTRNEAILDQSKFEVDYKYELNELDKVQALLLFNRHAFRMDHSPREFKGISRDIISNMGGLPLALQVVGSYLYKKNRKVWEDVKKKLKNQPHRDVQKILQISYDALDDEQKQIFLDIVCFFIGKTSKCAMYMWEDCGFYPSQGIEELKLRCLIKIGDDGEFLVHDQLRDLGRSIFCQGQPLEKRSGPWDNDYEGVPKVLRIDALRRPAWFPSRSPFWFCKTLCRHLSCFRFRDHLRAASSGTSNYELLSEVRWLKWRVQSDLSPSVHLSNLSVLNLYGSEIGEYWQGWTSFMASKRLKVLMLENCHYLRRTPDLSAFTQLKILNLSRCLKLEHLHPSIGKLTSLISLNLSFCTCLKELPKEVGKLKNLEELFLYRSDVTEIPMSIGSLRKLKTLSALGCYSLREISSSIGDLQNLQYLGLCCSAIKKRPSATGRLKNSQALFLNGYRHQEGEIVNLNGTSIFNQLESVSLQHLYLGSRNNLWSLPELPSSLQHLDLTGSDKLGSLPELPSSLQSLDLWACMELQSLPELPSSLQSLDLWGCKELRSLPKLPSSLERLNLFYCKKLRSLPELPSSLKHLDLGDCKELQSLPELPSSLRHLDLSGCGELQLLPELPAGLGYLGVTCLSLGLPQLLSHKAIIHLEKLHLEVCHLLEDIRKLYSIPLKLCFEEWDKLTSLTLSGLRHFEELSIKKCSSLEFISLEDCNSIERLRCLELPCLKEIEGLDGVEFLEELDFEGCKSMETLSDLTGCEKLRSLKVRNCKKLTQLLGLETLNLIDLDICGCDSLEAIPELSRTRIIRN